MAVKSTFRDLYRSTIKVSETRRSYSDSKAIRRVAIVPLKGTRSALFQYEHYGLTDQALHQVNILFSDLDVFTEDELESKYGYIETEHKGKLYYIQRPDLVKTPCKIRCNCVDFYFTFAWWDWQSHVIFGGKPRPYKRKTLNRKTLNRKPRNPGKHPGMCKHVFNTVKLMRVSGMTQ